MIKRKGIILLFLLSSLFSFGGASNLQPEKKPSHHPLIEKLGYIPKYNYEAYLLDFKKEMETETFRLLWGENQDKI